MSDKTPEERARQRADDYTGLMWHISAYVVVNAFLWTLDIATGGGVEWAFWTTIPWGLGLLFHVATYLIDGRRVGDRKYEQFLEQERARERSPRN